MTIEASEPTRFLPLSNLSFHILLALGAGPAHGYAIGKEVEERSRGKLKPTTGALYQALKRLADGGLLEEDREENARASDQRRKCFRLTGLGRRVAGLEAARLDELVSEARRRHLFSRP